MSKNFFTVHQIFFFLFLLLAQSQFGLGQDEDSNEVDGNVENKLPAFTAVSSLFFQPGTDYNVFFTAHPSDKKESLQLKCLLMANSNTNEIIQSESISLFPGESGRISIPLPQEMPRNETTWRLFAWSVTKDSLPKGYKDEAPHTLIVSSEVANEERQFLTKANLTEIFIQTDKPAYKPDDLVRIRVITMGSDGLPHLRAGINLTITDSKKNVMKKWEQPIELPESASVPSNVSTDRSAILFGEFQKKTNGLSAYEYQLSSEPILGNWTIEMEAGHIKEKMYFDVKKYILPKFQVKIHVPPVLYGTGDISTSATVKVSYTYGKDLQGSGNVTVTSDYGGTSKLQRFDLTNGQKIVQLKLSSPRGYSSTLHTITANVTEKNTERWQTGKATVRVFPQETYQIEWLNKPNSYKPGLPMTVQLKITGQDELPVKDIRPNALSITFPTHLNLPTRETSVPLSGIVSFSLQTPLQPLPSNTKFQALYKKHSQAFTLPTAQKATSSGIFIEVIPPPNSVNLIQGKSYDFSVRSNKPIRPELFHCLLWDDAAMDVYGAQGINNANEKDATEFPFSLQLPIAAYTELKVFVYFENGKEGRSEIISTSKAINTHNYLKIKVSKDTPVKTPAEATAPAAGNSPVATTPATTTTTTPEYEYVNDDPSNDPTATAAQPEPQPLPSHKLEVKPGAPVQIHFETYPNSTIAIRGIDQSLLLLTEQDNDLDPEKIKNIRLTAPPQNSKLDNIPTENATFLETFRRLGIAILSNEHFSSFTKLTATSTDPNNLEESEVAPSENALLDDSSIPEVNPHIRTKFPETWLWEEFQSSSNSSSTVLSKTLPDTLTSWIISGFSLNPKTGLGVASPATITGFMPFFVSLNLPYSVINLESFDLQVIVHNYLNRDVNVYVTLVQQQNSGFSFLEDRDKNNRNATRLIKVEKDHAAVAHFLVSAMAIGDVPIEVRAVTDDGSAFDSMIRNLKVKPDGVQETRGQVVLFEPKTGDKNLSRTASFDVKFPQTVVKGASSLQLTVFGDQMGTMTSNLGYVLELPYGCGEQNMARLVPNILALHYLSAINSDDKTTIKTAKSNIETGYGNQLLYQLADGSFSVYSTNTKAKYYDARYAKGTVWLTSLVLRWFVVAQQFITIDPNVINRAIKFIRKTQQPNGLFLQTSGFYHPEMRGRDGANGVALTAYVTLALIKANEEIYQNKDLDLKVAIENGMNFISRGPVYQLDDNYITNLVTTTLMAGNHSEKDRFFEKMEKQANTSTTTDGVKLKYWSMKNSKESARAPLAIEMTSYALLAHLSRQGTTDGSVFNIYRWLLNQRNSKGGFISTQDTTMGLTALAEFANKTIGNVQDVHELELDIFAASGSPTVNDTKLSVSVARWNRMVLQEFTLPATTTKVNINARGVARGLVQMTQTWHVPLNKRPGRTPPDSFNVVVNMSIPDSSDPTETVLNICVNSFHPSGATDSIAAVELPSGYVFYPEDYNDDSEFMASIPKNTWRFELKEGNSKMNVYYSSIPAYPPTCITLAATQNIAVADAKDSSVLVYKYVDPAKNGRMVYDPAHNLSRCQLCKNTPGCQLEGCV